MTPENAKKLARIAIEAKGRGHAAAEALCNLVGASNGLCPNASAALMDCLKADGVGLGDPMFDTFAGRASLVGPLAGGAP